MRYLRTGTVGTLSDFYDDDADLSQLRVAHAGTPLVLGTLAVLPVCRVDRNYEMDSANRLCLVLVGLTGLRRRLAMAVHESLSQRLVVRHLLRALDRAELDAYLTHRPDHECVAAHASA